MSVMDDVSLVDGAAYLCVLASGSAGNCSVLFFEHDGMRRVCLIDLGMSPRRTLRQLAELGVAPFQIDDVILTHLDADHYHPGWRRVMPQHVRIRVHESHVRELVRAGMAEERVTPFADRFVLQSGAECRAVLMAHDDAGVTVFRVDTPRRFGGGTLGFATDLGRVTEAMIELFRGAREEEASLFSPPAESEEGRAGVASVDVLAIESNYCPRMQAESDRPVFLIRRITGGRGHLSNEDALRAIGAIQPRSHVVLLHLSRECNDIELVSSLHDGADYHLTIASQVERTRMVRLCSGYPARVHVRPAGASLFERAGI